MEKFEDINVNEPYYSFLVGGEKTIEGRLNKGKFVDIKVGDVLLLNNNERFEVIGRREYENFKDMLEAEGYKKVLPDKDSLEEAEAVYYEFFTPEQEKKYGVVAFEVRKN